MDAKNNAKRQKLKPPVALTGTAKEGCIGPSIGLIDIGTSGNAYIFRVALPGVRNNESLLQCEIGRDGRVQIRGLITEGGALLKGIPTVYQMKMQQLCPPGQFTVSFNLPGPVDARLFTPTFRPDGVLEGVVMKCIYPRMYR